MATALLEPGPHTPGTLGALEDGGRHRVAGTSRVMLTALGRHAPACIDGAHEGNHDLVQDNGVSNTNDIATDSLQFEHDYEATRCPSADGCLTDG